MNTRITLVAALALAAGLVLAISGGAQAALNDRGGGLIYDDVLNVTWLQDANYSKTSGYDADGLMLWSEATTWATNLNYYDSVRNVTYNDWRLPTVKPSGSGWGFNFTSPSTELSYMYYVNLGNPGYYTPEGAVSGCFVSSYTSDTCLDNVGPFANLQPSPYWSGTVDSSNTAMAWYYDMSMGYQWTGGKRYNYYVWALRDGDVAAVPEADTWAMLLAGLGLIGMAARRRRS